MSNSKSKPWYKKSWVWLIAVVLVLGIIGTANDSDKNGGQGTKKQSASSSSAKQYRFAERADKQNTDVEVLPNEVAIIDGVKMTVTGVNYTSSIGQFDNADSGKIYAVVDVTLENTGKQTKPYNTYDFRIQTAGGQVLDSTIALLSTPLNSGDLVSGGKASGQVVFEPPVEDGHQYIIWKPGLSSDRAIVQVK
jgi:hypothetical protein